MKLDNSPARGTRDLLPSAVAQRSHVLAQISAVYQRYGYHRIETPCLEDLTRLQSGEGGENEKLIFRVLKRGLGDRVDGDTPLGELVDLGLRYDLTVPLTRFYGHNHAALPLPFRGLQFGPVWRAERPQKGRYRQFTQCDIDMIGEESVLAEVELVEATTEALHTVGLADATVRLSDRRFLSALADSAGIAEEHRSVFFIGLDKLDKIGWDGVRTELTDRGLPSDPVDAALGRIEKMQRLPAQLVADVVADEVPALADGVLADLAATVGCLRALSQRRGLRWEFDPTLVRGMGYYTGQIFEMAHPQSTSSIAGGGRYDKLVGRSLGRDVPACGFSIGFERVIELLGAAPRPEALAVLVDRDVPLTDALALAAQHRADGRSVSVVRRSGKLGAQLGRLADGGFTSFTYLRNEWSLGDPVEERTLGTTAT